MRVAGNIIIRLNMTALLQGRRISLKMEARCSPETSVDFQRITRRYIPEDRSRHTHLCGVLKLYIYVYTGARGSVVGCTMLQAGRSQVRFPVDLASKRSEYQESSWG
jgi:hypothetical protein